MTIYFKIDAKLLFSLYEEGPKSNQNRFLCDKPVVVQASTARCHLRQPSGISLLTGVIVGRRTAPWFTFVLKCFTPFCLFLPWLKGCLL